MYQQFKLSKGYEGPLQHCIERTVEQLLTKDTDVNHPGMLLGNIQSGKTRTFIGVIALAFDKGYEVTVILTKGTRALTEQTCQRLMKEFDECIENDEVQVFDIMKIPQDLSGYILEQKLIMVVKKEDDNLNRLSNVFFHQYPELSEKRVLIIDDEADFASVGYSRKKNSQTGEGELSFNVLSKLISEFRSELQQPSDFLQVTATPYSLYLQPAEVKIKDKVFEPVRPRFTELVPIHSHYVGGKYYFEDSQNENSPASYLHFVIPERELEILSNPHGSYLKNVLSTKSLEYFRFAITTFLVAGAIRILQNEQIGKKYKCSFIMHTDTSKAKHEWQTNLIKALIEALTELSVADLEEYLTHSYNDLMLSLECTSFYKPELEKVLHKVKEALEKRYVLTRVINSDNDVLNLLDHKTGELKLSSPYNLFIGGQILDRGVTIQNLIGFFYGRNPQKFQQDTVLQHSRMYGARSMEDMAVTRLYTTARIYEAMKKMHEFDTALRESFLNGNSSKSVIFIHKDAKDKIIPCSPNKILASQTITLRPHKRLLPYGFQTGPKTQIAKTVDEIEQLLLKYSAGNTNKPFLIDVKEVCFLIDKISSTYTYAEDDAYEWDVESFKATLQYLAEECTDINLKGKIYCIMRTDRNINRYKDNGREFSDVPENSEIDGKPAKAVAKNIPCLLMLKQNGNKDLGWRDTPFWWPVVYAPQNTKTAIFASQVKDDNGSGD